MKQLFKTSFLSGLSAIVKLIALLILNKVLAVYVGPAGYAVIGQFQNFIAICLGLPASINNGVVKYTAELDSTKERAKLWSTSVKFVGGISFFIGILIVIFSRPLANYFSLEPFENVFVLFGLAYSLYALNTFFLAILNGMGEIKSLVLSNISGSLLSLAIVVSFTYFWSLNGALIALVINQSAVFFITSYLLWRLSWFKLKFFKLKFELSWIKKLNGFIFIAVVSMLTAPTSSVLVRNEIINLTNTVEAGYWDALIKLSAAYMMVLTTILSIYFLPKFSKLNEKSKLIKEITLGIVFFSILFFIGATLLYIFRDFFVLSLFNKDFAPVTELIGLQLIADFIKVISWIFSFYMLSKAMTVYVITTQIIHAILYVGTSYLLLENLSVSGVIYASIVANFVYLLMCILVSARHINTTYKAS